MCLNSYNTSLGAVRDIVIVTIQLHFSPEKKVGRHVVRLEDRRQCSAQQLQSELEWTSLRQPAASLSDVGSIEQRHH